MTDSSKKIANKMLGDLMGTKEEPKSASKGTAYPGGTGTWDYPRRSKIDPDLNDDIDDVGDYDRPSFHPGMRSEAQDRRADDLFTAAARRKTTGGQWTQEDMPEIPAFLRRDVVLHRNANNVPMDVNPEHEKGKFTEKEIDEIAVEIQRIVGTCLENRNFIWWSRAALAFKSEIRAKLAALIAGCSYKNSRGNMVAVDVKLADSSQEAPTSSIIDLLEANATRAKTVDGDLTMHDLLMQAAQRLRDLQ